MSTSAPQAEPDAAPTRLPELSDDRIDQMEDSLFSDIARERTADRTRRVRRGRVWLGASAAAAIVVVAAVIAPSVIGVLAPSGADSAYAPAVGDVALQMDESTLDSGGAASESMLVGADADTKAASRDIVATASATVTVADVATAAEQVSQAAIAAGGYVESVTVGQTGPTLPWDGEGYDMMMPYPTVPGGGWVTVRVPADQLTAVIAGLKTVGDVTASSVTQDDVTAQSIDLKARIDASQQSVDRLTELMGQAGTVGDLIAAESALSERQATLESYQQQLEYLSDQVSMSSLTVNLTPVAIAVTADPAGFSDGLAAGWNGLVAALNGIVVALGFMIPWIMVIVVVGAAVWGIVVLARRARRKTAPPEA